MKQPSQKTAHENVNTQTHPQLLSQHTLKSGENLILRTPRTKDAQSLIDYMQKVDSETRFLAREPGEFSFTLDQEVAFIENLNDNKDTQFILAEIEGQVVGNVSVGRIGRQRRFSHRASMGITVASKHWRKGIGKHLMTEAIKWCRQNHIEQLELEVVAGNDRAKALYESFGFCVQGTKHSAMKYADGTYADEYLMWLQLDNK